MVKHVKIGKKVSRKLKRTTFFVCFKYLNNITLQFDCVLWGGGLKSEHAQHCHLVLEDQKCKELSQSSDESFSFSPLPLSHSQSPCYYRHVVSAHFCSRSHDVPKPPCSDVRLGPDTDRWWPGCAQRFLPERLGYAGVPRTGPGYR